MNTQTQIPDGFTNQDFNIMRRAIREEIASPYHEAYGPDWQAAVTGYLQLGGTDKEEVSDLMSLFDSACESMGVEF